MFYWWRVSYLLTNVADLLGDTDAGGLHIKRAGELVENVDKHI